MSRSPKHQKDGIILSSTLPYVDALLTVSFAGSNSSPPSNDSKASDAVVYEFKVHRIVLSRLSAFFKKEFMRLEAANATEQTELPDNNEEQALWKLDVAFTGQKERPYFNLFPKFLDFLYGKPLSSQESGAFEYLELASRFEVPRLTALMSDFLVSGITKETSLSLLQKAIQFDAIGVQDRCLEIIARNFQALLPTIKPMMNALPLRVFSALMNHPSLSVTSEYRVYKTVRSYYGHKVDENGVTLLDKYERKSLFSAVRLAHLKYGELEKVIRDEVVPKSLLSEALTYRLAQFEKAGQISEDSLPLRLRKRSMGRLFEPPSGWNEQASGTSTQSTAVGDVENRAEAARSISPLDRSQSSSASASSDSTVGLSSSSSRALAVASTGLNMLPNEIRGVVHFLATGGGKTEWKNPSLTGSIKVSCSSIEKGKAHHFVDLEAQDCWTMDIPASWVAIDLRQGKLVPSHYTLRHGGNSKMDTLRNWVLQACDSDGDRWIEISRHTNDASLQGAFGTHTWKITTDLQRPFRQFRILQTGHNSGNSNFLSISYIELYGLYFPKSQS